MKQLDIPKLVRRVRKKHDLTQEQLARKLNVTMMTVSRWETGRSKPHPVFVEKLRGMT